MLIMQLPAMVIMALTYDNNIDNSDIFSIVMLIWFIIVIIILHVVANNTLPLNSSNKILDIDDDGEQMTPIMIFFQY